ncbi:MAG: hypothetical protein AAF646_13595 [Pseudomonadota bacterium]
MKEFAFLVFGFVVLAAASVEAQHARTCGERDLIVERLANGYGESRQSMGLGSNNTVMEVYASEETGTWTITVTMPNGMMCLVASGRAYEALAEDLEPALGQKL